LVIFLIVFTNIYWYNVSKVVIYEAQAELGGQLFETGRSTFIDEKKSGGLKGGFSDISIHQSIYSVNLHANVGPKWKTEGEDDKVVTSVTRTWDDQY
jgi:hypothetical protein